MSKELEALEALKMQVGNIHYFDFSKGYPNQTTIELKDSELFTTIEKPLKALEIIKEKQVDIHWLKGCKSLEEYNDCVNPWEEPLTQEEYDLLKEVLDE